jgi:hypothetical protein
METVLRAGLTPLPPPLLAEAEWTADDEDDDP